MPDRLLLRSFGTTGSLLQEIILDIPSTFNGTKILSLAASGVASITFGVTGDWEDGRSGGGILANNLTFTITGDVPAVPFPASALLLMSGLAALGAARRRKA